MYLNWKWFPRLNWVSRAIDLISQSERAGKRLFQRADWVKGCHTASKANCTQLLFVLTHTLHLCFITILLLPLWDLTQCVSTYGKTYFKKIPAGHKGWKESLRWGQMNTYVIICLFHSVAVVNCTVLIYRCVLAQICGADLAIGGGHLPQRHPYLITV